MEERALYEKMLTIRLFEDEMQKLCLSGEAGDLHFNKGQEAISVGACEALRWTDYTVTHHRTIAHSIARGVPLGPLVAELLGKATGFNKGMAGEMHVRYPALRYMFSFQLVGTCVPVATGLAWAVKNYRKEDNIVAVFFGDAATGNGQTHEGLNIASVRKVPLLLICENNGLAGNVRKEYYLPTDTVSERAAAYGIQASKLDGNHLPDVIESVRKGAKYVREKSAPYLLEMDTTRLCVKGDTLILGDNKPISSIQVGDYAAGLHGLGRVVKTFARPYRGELVAVKARGLLPFEVTPEHPVLTCRSVTSRKIGSNHKLVGFGSFEWKRPMSLVPKKMQKDGDYLVLPRVAGTIEVSELDLSSWAAPRGLNVMKTKGYPVKLILTPKLAWFLGLYVAEGSSAGSAGFSLSLNRNETEIVSEVQEIARTELRRSTTLTRSSSAIQVRVNSPVISRALAAWCGKGALNKQIPDFILYNKNLDLTKSFIDGYAAGDGHQTRNGYTETTTISCLLALQMQLLLARLGYMGHIYTMEPSEKSQVQGRKVNMKLGYRVRWRTTPTKSKRQANQHVFAEYILTPVTAISTKSYAGTVHNIETADNTYTVSNAVVHNCWHKQGQPDARSKEEIAEQAKRDPLLYEERRLSIKQEEKDKLATRINEEIQNAISAARKAPFPQYPLAHQP
ncbi:MAG: thiamine pyrophosphate-dependent enzyme [Nitrososphaerales archaeon]|nr:thiamine pyrophosphate-dependent enzyme [Nitrososphaerales archaeon]